MTKYQEAHVTTDLVSYTVNSAVTRMRMRWSKRGRAVWTTCCSVALYCASLSILPCCCVNQWQPMTTNTTQNSEYCWRPRLICCSATSTDTSSSVATEHPTTTKLIRVAAVTTRLCFSDRVRFQRGAIKETGII